MPTPLFVRNSITINAPASAVWDALVNPQKTRIYMFGCEAISGWKPGDELIWKGIFDGHELVAVKGKIISIEPGTRLEYTTFDPNNPELEDLPENYVNVIYELHEIDGKTMLTVSQGDFSTVANGEQRYKEVDNNGEGWNPILVQIKSLVEKN
jgi:uncharacterized protein YndB with AHSA1/START domain